MQGNSYNYNGGNLTIAGPSTLRVAGGGYYFSGKTFTFDSTGGGTIDAEANGAGGFVLATSNTFSTSGGSQDIMSGTNPGGGSNLGYNLNGQSATFNVALGSDPVSDLNVTGTIWNTGSITKTGPGRMLLSGTNNSYSSGTTINNGTLILGNSGALGTGGLALSGGTLDLAGYSPTVAGLGGSAGVITSSATSGATLSVNQTAVNTFSGTLQDGAGTLALFKTGAAALVLAGTNTYSGGTTVNSGTLGITADAALGNAAGGVTFSNNSTLQAEANGIVLNAARGLTVNNGVIGAIDTQGNNMAIAGAIGGGGGLKKVGAGTLTLTAANTFSGTTVVSNGTISIGNALALQNSTVSDGNDYGLTFATGITSATLGGLSGTNPYLLQNADGNPVALSIGNNNANTTYSGSLSGGGSIDKIGSGMFTATGANTYFGATTINSGVLQIGSSAALPSGTAVAVNGTLDLNGFNATVGNLSGSGTVDTAAGGAPTLTVNSGTFSGILQNTAGSLALYKTSPGTLTLNAGGTYAGGTTMNNGMLVLADGPNTSTSVSAIGSGTLTLNGGVLAGGAAGGSVAGLVQAGSAAHTIAPGAALLSGYGTLNLNGGLNTNANTTLAFNVTNTPQSGGVYVGDLINMNSSSLTVSGGSIAFVGASPTALGDYRLIANLGSGSTNPTGFSLPAVPNGSNDIYSLSTTADPGNLDLVVASAATFSGSATWTGASGNPVWSNSGNWNDNGNGTIHGVPGISLSRTADTVTFNGTDSAAAITLDVSPSLAAISFSGTDYTLTGSGTLTMNGGTAGSTITVGGGTQSIAGATQIAGGNLIVAASNLGLLTLSGSISDDGFQRSLTLTGDGSGQLILSGTGSYMGGTIVEAGTLIVNTSSALPDGSSLTVGAGGTLIFDASVAGSPATGLSRDSIVPASAAVAAVPEPGTLALLAAGLVVGLGAWQRKRRITKDFA